MTDSGGRSTLLHTNGKITHTLSSNGNPQSDDALKNMGCENHGHYRRLYVDLSDPIVFEPVAVKLRVPYSMTFCACFFLLAHREVSALTGELFRGI